MADRTDTVAAGGSEKMGWQDTTVKLGEVHHHASVESIALACIVASYLGASERM